MLNAGVKGPHPVHARSFYPNIDWTQILPQYRLDASPSPPHSGLEKTTQRMVHADAGAWMKTVMSSTTQVQRVSEMPIIMFFCSS